MGRKLNLSHLSEEETDRILSVLQKDYEVRQAEKDRLGSFEHTLQKEQNKTQVLAQQTKFNKNCCIRCCQVFGLIFNRRRQCYHCGYNICKDCCDYQADTKHYVCHVCVKEKELDKQTCSWFYNAAGHKFKRCGSAKVVRSLYKTTSYSDTELESGYNGSGQSRSYNVTTRTKVRPPLPDEFRDDREDRGDEEDDEDSDELPSSSPSSSTRHHPPSSPTTRSLGKSPASRAGSLDTLNLLSSSSSSSLPSSSRQLRTRTPDPEKSKPLRSSDRGKSGSSESLRSRSKWDRDSHGRDKVKKDTKDIYRHAFESARKAEEYKFKAKFDALLNDLHRTLDTKSPRGLSDSFASTSYGEVMLSFRGRVKDLLIGFNQRLQLAYESFEKQDAPGDHGPEVKQHVSRFLEDLLGESLDLTSDEAVSDLSSLSDDSANDRHVYEDQIAQAVVSKILENHRREVSHTLGQERRLGGHLNSPSLVPSALDDDDDDYDNRRSPPDDVDVKDTDISKDFEDLKNFVQETQSRSRLYDDRSSDSLDGGGGLDDSGDEARPSARQVSSFDTYSSSREQSLPDFSEFDQIDFNSAELDPDLLQMNLGVIVEETEEELEAEATDTHWRENWIFKGTGVSPYDNALVNKHIRGNNDDQPQYMMVPRPDDNLAPRIGNKDVDQLSDLSDNEDLTDDDNSFYPRTSEELARISRHKRSSTPPSLSSPSLIPNHHNNHDNEDDDDEFLAPKRKLTPMPKGRPSQNLDVDLDFEDIGVGTEDFVGPIVEPSAKELKLLEDLVPADDDDPRFVVTPDSVTIQEGEPVKLSCRVAGTSPIDVFWYREQDEVEELEESEDVELQTDGDRNLATLYNVGKRQAGQYMCIALSDKGKAIKYLTVTVKENKQELKKPEFLKELKDVEVLEGQSVKFRCKVKGYPQPRINWYKDGNLLRSNKSCRIEKFGNRDYILTIDCATMDDDAEYMVQAKNVAGEVRSTAQVIVEPYSENHPWLSKSRSHSISTVNTDSESDRPSSTQLDDSLIYPARSSPFRDSNRSFNTPRSPAPEEEKVDGLVSKVTAARNNVRKEAEGMLATAEELTALNQHLEDMERHLDNLEGRNSPKSSNPSHDIVDYSALVDEATALQMIEDEKEMGQAAKGVRKMTSNALSVLRAAEEIIESERKAMESPSSPSPPLSKRDNSAPFSSLTEENNNKSVSLAPELTQSQLTSHSDLNKSVSSGYGTNSMASSAVEDNESVAGSQVSQQEDEFAMYLPSLDDDISGSYREEVSISLSSKKPSGAPFSSSPASSSGSSTLANSYSSSSSSSAKTVQSSQPTSTPARNSTLDSAVSSSRRPPVSVQNVAASTDEQDSRVNTMLLDSLASGREAEEEDLVLNFGPKEIDSRTYGRDYEVKPMRQKSVDGKGENEGEGSEHKRWSVSLDSFSPVAEVVNRQPSVEETEENIYLTAGKMFHLEDRVKELESRVQGEGDQASPRTMAALQDQVAKTAAQVARSEKDVSSIERAVNTLQFSPRSSRGSNSSNSSTPRESIDSGVSSFTPERHERPLPTHMVGQTQEEEVPESRAEYDADSGIELPSVSRLRAMFGSNKKEDSSEGNFKRESGDTAIHSITARSLSKDQLQKLREAGNTNMTDIIRIRDQPAQSTASVQLRSKPVAAGAGHPDRRSYPQGAASASLSPAQQQQQQKGGTRQVRTPNLSGPAHYQQLDPSKDPVLIYPEEHEGGQDSAASSTPKPTRLRTRSRSPPPRSGTPRPKSAVILTAPSAGLSNHANRPAASRPRAQSSSEASGSQENLATPRIRSGCISARAAFWERRIMQGEATDTNVEEEFPEMVEDSEA